jgi:glycosyltransferase involved in cell wall biosynthesis
VEPLAGAAETEGAARVSVVVPCYRCADTIDRALGSVGAQSLAPAEVILVDDHSGDGTLDRLLAAQSRLGTGRVKVVDLPRNGGPSVARNAGWDAATQPYVAFLDSDETWHPRKLELQFGWMAARPEVALTGHPRIDHELPGRLPDRIGVRRVRRRTLLLANQFPTASVMLRRELPVRFEPAKRHSEDYLLWLQIVARGYDAWRFQVPLVRAFKAPFGDGGLSRDLWKMEQGELDTYRRLHRQGLLSAPELSLLVPLSLGKHLVRTARVAARARVRGPGEGVGPVDAAR